MRRVLPILVSLVALAGCSTLSDSDAVARVDDVTLTTEQWEDRLIELGVTDADVLPGDPVREELTRWIQSELVADGDAAEIYDEGVATAGVVCIAVMVVEDAATSDAAVAEIESGRSFDEVFAEYNIDPSLVEVAGAIPCLTAEQVVESADVPFVAVAAELSADSPVGAAPLDSTDTEAAWVVLGFRTFDELDDTQRDEALAAIDLSAVIAIADIYVDPRYGVFDSDTGTVVALS